MFCLICGSNKINQQKKLISTENNENIYKINLCILNRCSNCNHKSFKYENSIIINQEKKLKSFQYLKKKSQILNLLEFKYSKLKNKKLILNIIPFKLLNVEEKTFDNIINANLSQKRLFEIKDLKKRLLLFKPSLNKVPDVVFINYLDIDNDPISTLANVYSIINEKTTVIIRVKNLRNLFSDIFFTKRSNNHITINYWNGEIIMQKQSFSLKSLTKLVKVSNFKIDLINFIKFDSKNIFKIFFSLFFYYEGNINLYLKKKF